MRPVFRVVLTLVALTVAATHVFVPSITVDSITVILLVLAAFPWIFQYIRELEIPGVVKITMRDMKSVTDKLTADITGGVAGTTVVVPAGQVTFQGHPPTVVVGPSEEDSLDSLRHISESDPNLALVGFRIEVEKRLRKIASAAGFSESLSGHSLQKVVGALANQDIIEPRTASGLLELIALGNRAAHGAQVTSDAAQWMLEIGPSILLRLDKLLTDMR